MLLEPSDSQFGLEEEPSAMDPEVAIDPTRVRAMVDELVRILRGYVVLHDAGRYTFGLPDGPLLRDAWSVDAGGDAAEAYAAFLRSKISEGFVPRADRVVALVEGASPEALDAFMIERAYREKRL